jgi:glutaredoxin
MDKWVVLGKPECPWCDKVKQLLHEHHIEFTYMDVTQSPDLWNFLINCGVTTVPQVFQGDFWLGGYIATQDYLEF